MRTLNFNESKNHFIILMVESFFFSCFLYILFWLIFIFFLMTWYLLLLQARSTPAKGNGPGRHLSQQFRQKQFVHEIARCFRQRIFAWLNPRPDVISDRKSCIEVTLIHPGHQVLPGPGDPFTIRAVLSFLWMFTFEHQYSTLTFWKTEEGETACIQHTYVNSDKLSFQILEWVLKRRAVVGCSVLWKRHG